MKLYIAIPCRTDLNAKFVLALIQCINQLHSTTGYYPEVRFLMGRTNIDQSRSILTTDFYRQSGEQDLLLFIDSDHIFDVADVVNAIKVGGDVSCGIYPNALGMPTFYPLNYADFLSGRDNRVLYAGTGFMLIRKPILHRIAAHCAQLGVPSAWISAGHPNVIPFFKQQIVDSELLQVAGCRDWLGEDYSFCHLVRKLGGEIRGFMTKTLGHEVAKIMIFQPHTTEMQKGIHYYCGNSAVRFCPTDRNLGGSEQAVVNLSRAWAAAGQSVTVYGNVVPGVYEGVVYRPAAAFQETLLYERVIFWRGFGLAMLPRVNASKVYVDLHDATMEHMLPPELIPKINKIFVKSQWHRANWPYIPDSKFVVIKNGIHRELFDQIREEGIQREPHRICYTSCYTRGLIPMIERSWPRIRERLPDAELHVYYGYTGVQDPATLAAIRRVLTAPGVIDHGRTSIDEIAREKFRSSLHFYICNTPKTETDCISVRESRYAGCPPLVCNEGVFTERDCIRITCGHRHPDVYQFAADTVISLLTTDRSKLETLPPVSELSWTDVAHIWLQELDLVATST